MVAKIGSGSSIMKALLYNQNKVEKGQAKVISQNLMYIPHDGNYTIGVCLKTFNPYLWANQQTQKPVLHISINPDPKDKVSDDQLTEIAHTYMEKMGYGNQPFLVFKHEDIDRHHIHIVSLRINENGKKLDHNFENRRSMQICRDLEKKYGLIPADVKQKAKGNSLKAVDIGKGNIKQQIANVIRPTAESWHFQSIKEYKALLSTCNVELIEVKGNQNGNTFEGIVYAATDKYGKVVSTPIKSSRFGKEVGKNGIEKRIEKSKGVIKNKKLKESPKANISKALETCKDREDFEKQLLKNRISVLFRENESGRIYGVTFIDHRQKFVFNGSRLGKNFSANVFNEKFNGEKHCPEKEKSPEVFPPQPTFISDSTIENLFSLLSIENRGENYEEEAFILRMKRKKRRKRKP